jgi:hypothetical protein
VAFGNELVIAWTDVSWNVYVQRIGEDCLPIGEPVKVNVNLGRGSCPALGVFDGVLYVAWCAVDVIVVDNYCIYWSKSTDCLSWQTPAFQKVKGPNVLPTDVARSTCAPCFCCENGKVTLCWIQQNPDPIYKCVLSAEASERVVVDTTASQTAWGLCQALGIANSEDRYVLFVTTFNASGFAIYLLPSDGDIIAFTLTASGDSNSKYAVAGQFEGGSSKVCMVWTGMTALLQESELDLP